MLWSQGRECRCCSVNIRLESEEQQERHHETEKPHSLGQGETENGVREELLFEGWVSGVADDKRTEDGTDTSTGAGNSDGSSASADVLGGRVDVHSPGEGQMYGLIRNNS